MISPERIRSVAGEIGFELVRFGPADPAEHAGHFVRWLAAGRAGEMRYLHQNRERITTPTAWAPHARSVIALATRYGADPGALADGGRIARYAVGRDYHRVLGRATRRLRDWLAAEGVAPADVKVGTDAVPVLERALAVRAGIGFLAKSSMVISAQHGPYLLLSELVTPLDLPVDRPAPGSCGTCTRCLDACPTGAITAPFQVDARRCLSYTTIELRGFVPRALRAAQGDWLFGCDVCLEVCPYTRFAPRGPRSLQHDELARPHPVVEAYTLVGILSLTSADYERHWIGTAMRRATRQGLRRNAAVVLGNRRDETALPALRRALTDEDPVVRGHAAWAIGRIDPADAALATALPVENDPRVRAEIVGAREGAP